MLPCPVLPTALTSTWRWHAASPWWSGRLSEDPIQGGRSQSPKTSADAAPGLVCGVTVLVGTSGQDPHWSHGAWHGTAQRGVPATAP